MRIVWSLLASLSACGLLLACSGGGDAGLSGDEAQALAMCEDVMEAYCVKGVTCAPPLAEEMFGISGVSECAQAAADQCAMILEESQEETGGDDCVIADMPTLNEIDACVAQINGASCTGFAAEMESGACADVADKFECEASTDPGPGPDVQGGEEDTGSPVEVNTAACEAAVVALCAELQDCAGELSLGPVVQATINSCDTSIAANEDVVAQACESYLQGADPNAYWLATASVSDVESCIDSDCDESTVEEVATALGTFLVSGDYSDLGDILAPFMTNCL